jgi:hypothetical protein
VRRLSMARGTLADPVYASPVRGAAARLVVGMGEIGHVPPAEFEANHYSEIPVLTEAGTK